MEKVMINGLRIWFLALYIIGIIVLLVKFIPTRDRAKAAERRIKDSRRLLPMIFLPIDWFVPPPCLVVGDWSTLGCVAASPHPRFCAEPIRLDHIDLGAKGPRPVSGSPGRRLPRPRAHYRRPVQVPPPSQLFWRPGSLAGHSPGDGQLAFSCAVVSGAGWQDHSGTH